MSEDQREQETRSELTLEQRDALLELARTSIETHLKGGTPEISIGDDPRLKQHGAAFVTLSRAGKLRGCIGYSEPLYPLHETVARCAVAAATQDYRFAPVTLEELVELSISISALTPLEKLERVADLEPGRHGLMVVGEGRKGLLLPQVASERGWDAETFLNETCRKAGLPTDAWRKDDVELFVFQAEVFGEE